MARNGGFVAKSQALSLRDEVLLTASFFLTNCKLLHKLNPLGKLGVKITWSIQCTALVSNEIHSVLLGHIFVHRELVVSLAVQQIYWGLLFPSSNTEAKDKVGISSQKLLFS